MGVYDGIIAQAEGKPATTSPYDAIISQAEGNAEGKGAIAGYPIAAGQSNAPIHHGSHEEPGVYDIGGNTIKARGETLEKAAAKLTSQGYFVAIRHKGEPGIESDHLHFADPNLAPKESARLRQQQSRGGRVVSANSKQSPYDNIIAQAEGKPTFASSGPRFRTDRIKNYVRGAFEQGMGPQQVKIMHPDFAPGAVDNEYRDWQQSKQGGHISDIGKMTGAQPNAPRVVNSHYNAPPLKLGNVKDIPAHLRDIGKSMAERAQTYIPYDRAGQLETLAAQYYKDPKALNAMIATAPPGAFDQYDIAYLSKRVVLEAEHDKRDPGTKGLGELGIGIVLPPVGLALFGAEVAKGTVEHGVKKEIAGLAHPYVHPVESFKQDPVGTLFAWLMAGHLASKGVGMLAGENAGPLNTATGGGPSAQSEAFGATGPEQLGLRGTFSGGIDSGVIAPQQPAPSGLVATPETRTGEDIMRENIAREQSRQQRQPATAPAPVETSAEAGAPALSPEWQEFANSESGISKKSFVDSYGDHFLKHNLGTAEDFYDNYITPLSESANAPETATGASAEPPKVELSGSRKVTTKAIQKRLEGVAGETPEEKFLNYYDANALKEHGETQDELWDRIRCP